MATGLCWRWRGGCTEKTLTPLTSSLSHRIKAEQTLTPLSSSLSLHRSTVNRSKPPLPLLLTTVLACFSIDSSRNTCFPSLLSLTSLSPYSTRLTQNLLLHRFFSCNSARLTQQLYSRLSRSSATILASQIEAPQKSHHVVNMIGVHFEDDHAATGFGNHIARLILCDEWHANLSFEDGVKMLEKYMCVLLCRDRFAVNKFQVPVGGCYRLVYIPVSNSINSGINKIFVLTQFNSVSLNHHLSRTYLEMVSTSAMDSWRFCQPLKHQEMRV